jgi:hypothetical protein
MSAGKLWEFRSRRAPQLVGRSAGRIDCVNRMPDDLEEYRGSTLDRLPQH